MSKFSPSEASAPACFGTAFERSATTPLRARNDTTLEIVESLLNRNEMVATQRRQTSPAHF
jgi:hypothetical protein